jgi:hypothetical protein
VPEVYGFSVRQIQRWTAEGRLRRVYVSGPTGPCMLYREDLDEIIRKATIPPGMPAGRRPRRRKV